MSICSVREACSFLSAATSASSCWRSRACFVDVRSACLSLSCCRSASLSTSVALPRSSSSGRRRSFNRALSAMSSRASRPAASASQSEPSTLSLPVDVRSSGPSGSSPSSKHTPYRSSVSSLVPERSHLGHRRTSSVKHARWKTWPHLLATSSPVSCFLHTGQNGRRVPSSEVRSQTSDMPFGPGSPEGGGPHGNNAPSLSCCCCAGETA
mmetsp:Transcript_92340/g.287832  ORF Transcript_92340/g.287832 Transcript_92340/m.287832 type:complete len:210 (-) Transcript_92340:2-631(-)